MYHEIEGQLSIEPIIFDDDELIARGHHYPYSEIESLEITSAQLFSPYGILTYTWAASLTALAAGLLLVKLFSRRKKEGRLRKSSVLTPFRPSF